MITKLTSVCCRLLLLISLLSVAAACNKDEEQASISSVTEVHLTGEGTAQEIAISSNKWSVAFMGPHGDLITDKDGKPLQLTGIGSIQADWCILTRNDNHSLSISANDHFDNYERSAILVLQTGIYHEEITVLQSSSFASYDIKSIAYSLGPDDVEMDGRSRWEDFTIRNYTKGESLQYIYPYYSTRLMQRFKSDDRQAFYWAEDRPELMVVAPAFDSPYKTGKLVMAPQPIGYHNLTHAEEHPKKEFSIEVRTPSLKQTNVHTDIPYKVRSFTYHLTIVNRNTQQERIIKGKLEQEYPYGHKVTKQVVDLED